jgi:hypothetical protein
MARRKSASSVPVTFDCSKLSGLVDEVVSLAGSFHALKKLLDDSLRDLPGDEFRFAPGTDEPVSRIEVLMPSPENGPIRTSGT